MVGLSDGRKTLKDLWTPIRGQETSERMKKVHGFLFDKSVTFSLISHGSRSMYSHSFLFGCLICSLIWKALLSVIPLFYCWSSQHIWWVQRLTQAMPLVAKETRPQDWRPPTADEPSLISLRAFKQCRDFQIVLQMLNKQNSVNKPSLVVIMCNSVYEIRFLAFDLFWEALLQHHRFKCFYWFSCLDLLWTYNLQLA